MVYRVLQLLVRNFVVGCGLTKTPKVGFFYLTLVRYYSNFYYAVSLGRASTLNTGNFCFFNF